MLVSGMASYNSGIMLSICFRCTQITNDMMHRFRVERNLIGGIRVTYFGGKKAYPASVPITTLRTNKVKIRGKMSEWLRTNQFSTVCSVFITHRNVLFEKALRQLMHY